MVPESHVMVEKIVHLQRVIAKKQEKLEFLEEHLDTLTDDVKKKTRLIQHYVLQQEAGALATSNMDANKVQ